MRYWYLLGCSATKGPQQALLRTLLGYRDERKNVTGDNVLFENWYLLGVKKISSHAHKAESWCLLRVIFKIYDEHPPSFLYGSPCQESMQLASLVASLRMRKDLCTRTRHRKFHVIFDYNCVDPV